MDREIKKFRDELALKIDAIESSDIKIIDDKFARIFQEQFYKGEFTGYKLILSIIDTYEKDSNTKNISMMLLVQLAKINEIELIKCELDDYNEGKKSIIKYALQRIETMHHKKELKYRAQEKWNTNYNRDFVEQKSFFNDFI